MDTRCSVCGSGGPHAEFIVSLAAHAHALPHQMMAHRLPVHIALPYDMMRAPFLVLHVGSSEYALDAGGCRACTPSQHLVSMPGLMNVTLANALCEDVFRDQK